MTGHGTDAGGERERMQWERMSGRGRCAGRSAMHQRERERARGGVRFLLPLSPLVSFSSGGMSFFAVIARFIGSLRSDANALTPRRAGSDVIG